MPAKTKKSARILITGVTGYVGGRLVDHLLDKNYTLRVMSRDLGRLKQRPWSDSVEQVEADVFDQPSLSTALKDVDIAYYLIHSMGGRSNDDFASRDLEAARNFALAASKQGVS